MNRQDSEKLITLAAADLLISHRDGDMTLLYLYLCRTGCTDREKAGVDLFMPRQRLNEAFERLEMCGLLPLSAEAPRSGMSVGPAPRYAAADSPAKENPIAPAQELPEYTAQDVRIRSEQDSAFSAVLKEARLIMGRALSTPDLIKMLGIYDHLDLPADVMMELMHFVADSYREKYGESRRPTARAFEREAQVWAEKKITDFDAAENHIRRVRERKGMEAQIKEALDIRDRGFTDTESLYVAQWQDWGFGPEEIHLAYDRAVTKTGKRSLAYTNGILQNWHERKLHTLQEILEKDGPSPRAVRTAPSSGGKGIDVQKIGEIAEIMKGAGT